ncbi:hypothetical protein MBLNU230_g6462t1 [Neophaeotheca triangularis]
MDRYSPVAPARIRALVLPVGQVERSRFLHFVRRLQNEVSLVPLEHIDLDEQLADALLSPKNFSDGFLLYDFATAAPTEQQQQLSPFELFREHLLVVGVIDGQISQDGQEREGFEGAAEYLRDKHPRVVHRQLLVLDPVTDAPTPPGAIAVARADHNADRALKTAICELSSRFLVELSTYAKAMQASPSIPTPGQTARRIQRTTSLRDGDRRPTSGTETPTSPQGDDGSRPSSRGQGSPAPATSFTSFDQMSHRSSTPTALTSSEGRAKSSTRESSKDRVSVQGFGTGLSADKTRKRGKARVGIVVGTIHMIAGQWREALHLLVEHTNTCRTLSDQLWYAKGLENIVVCLLLHSWSGLEYQIPSMCFSFADRPSSTSVAKRFSVKLPNDQEPAGAGNSATTRRLSTFLPDLLRQILTSYHGNEGALELPALLVSEATLRFAKLLAVALGAGGGLTSDALRTLIAELPSGHDVTSPGETDFKRSSMTSSRSRTASMTESTARGLSKGQVVEILAQASASGDDGLMVGEQIMILAGIASIYGLLSMDRKKAMVLREMISKLTFALIQARKLGAAEMGIHPAASLSVDTGAATILAIADESGGVEKMMSELAAVYGAELVDQAATNARSFGSEALKMSIMREMVAFCEASPDLNGVLRLTASLLRAAVPDSAADVQYPSRTGAIARDEQIRLAATIGRTIGVSKHLGLSGAQATYWDQFLVRDLQILPSAENRALIPRSKLAAGTTSDSRPSPNRGPLLYDPNAKRTATAEQIKYLVQHEPCECTVTLQNPLDVQLDVENLEVVAEDAEVQTRFQHMILPPTCLKQVPITLIPTSIGEIKMSGCRVKISGCSAREFPIIRGAAGVRTPRLLKDLGQEARNDRQSSPPESAVVKATVTASQPFLNLERTSLQHSSLMLLDGERASFEITVRNTTNIAAVIIDTVPSSPLQSKMTKGPSNMPPNTDANFTYEISAYAGMTTAVAELAYGNADTSDPEASKWARTLAVPVGVTVNAALEIHQLDALPLASADDSFLLSFNLTNSWPKPINFSCVVNGNEDEVGIIAPGEVRKQYLQMQRWEGVIMQDLTAVRETFWQRLRIDWSSADGRVGEVSTQGLMLKPEAVELVRGSALQISLGIARDGGGLDAMGEKPSAKVGSFVVIRAVLHRRGRAMGPLSLELLPRMQGNVVRDHQKLAVTGTMHQIVMAEDAKVEVDFALCPLLAGAVEVDAVVRSALPADGNSKESWCSDVPVVIQVE